MMFFISTIFPLLSIPALLLSTIQVDNEFTPSTYPDVTFAQPADLNVTAFFGGMPPCAVSQPSCQR